MGSLNIKNEATYRLIRELAELTGESMTTAVTVAVRDRLARVRQEEPGGGMAERLREIGADMRARLPADFATGDPTETLYDRDGIPR
jgi:antitoxin VapB